MNSSAVRTDQEDVATTPDCGGSRFDTAGDYCSTVPVTAGYIQLTPASYGRVTRGSGLGELTI